jgi:hypothetical protein
MLRIVSFCLLIGKEKELKIFILFQNQFGNLALTLGQQLVFGYSDKKLLQVSIKLVGTRSSGQSISFYKDLYCNCNVQAVPEPVQVLQFFRYFSQTSIYLEKQTV